MVRPHPFLVSALAAVAASSLCAGATVKLRPSGLVRTAEQGDAWQLPAGKTATFKAEVDGTGGRDLCFWTVLEQGVPVQGLGQFAGGVFQFTVPQGAAGREFTIQAVSRAETAAMDRVRVRIIPTFGLESKAGPAPAPGPEAGPGQAAIGRVASTQDLVDQLPAALRTLVGQYADWDNLKHWPAGPGDAQQRLEVAGETCLAGIGTLRINGVPYQATVPTTVGYGMPVQLEWLYNLDARLWLQAFQAGREICRREVTGLGALELAFTDGPVAFQVKAQGEPVVDDLFGEPAGLVGAIEIRGVLPLAGNPVTEPGCVDGLGVQARFQAPLGLAWAGEPGESDLLVADPDAHVLRRVGRNGSAWTVLGRAGDPGHGPGDGGAARLQEPTFLAACKVPQGNASGRFLLSDTGNHRLLEIEDIQGTLSPRCFAGVAGEPRHQDGPLLAARFHRPMGLAFHHHPDGERVYVADAGSCTIRMIRDGQVSTLAGSPGQSGTADLIGAEARFTRLKGLALAQAGNLLYIADGGAIRTLDLDTLLVQTLLGRVEESKEDAFRSRVELKDLDQARLKDPMSLLVSGEDLVIADAGHRAIQVWQPLTGLTVLAGDPEGPAGTRFGPTRDGDREPAKGSALLEGPRGLACGATFGGCPALYVADGRSLVRIPAWRTQDSPVLEEKAMAIIAPTAGIRAHQPFKAGFTYLGNQGSRGHYDFLYEFFCLEANGQEAARFQGRGSFAVSPLPWPVTFRVPGTATLRLRLKTPEGRTQVWEQAVTVN